MVNRESALAHHYLDGKEGIEIGGGAHNSFNIVGCLNVDYTDNMNTIYKKMELAAGAAAPMPVDIVADGSALPFEYDSLDYILSSHVMEHFYDPIGVLEHWIKIIRPGGYIFMIIPHKDRTFDCDRPCTPLGELIDRHTTPGLPVDVRQDHKSVWRTGDFLDLCLYMGLYIVDWRDSDDKVGNGFLIVIQKGQECLTPSIL